MLRKLSLELERSRIALERSSKHEWALGARQARAETSIGIGPRHTVSWLVR